MPDDLIRPFDHSDVANLPEYAAVSAALDKFAHAVPEDVDRDRWVQIVREMAIALPYSDNCDCPECRRVWTCGYSTSVMDMIW